MLLYSGKNIGKPNFYLEKENTNKDIESKYKIDVEKIFSSLNDVYKYIEELVNIVNSNLKDFDKKLNEDINDIDDLFYINNQYKSFTKKIYKKLEKVEAFVLLRKYLNIYDENIKKNNEIISEDIFVLKTEIFEFSKKIIDLKEIIERKKQKKSNKNNEKEEKENQDRKTLYNKIMEYYKNINVLKNIKDEEEEEYTKLLNDNILLYISIYEFFKQDKNLFENNFGYDENIRKKDINIIINNIFNLKHLKKYNNIKKIAQKNISNNKKEYDINKIEKLIIDSSKILNEDYNKKINKILNNNQIDIFKNKNKIPKNTTIPKYKGYILLQNTKNNIDIFTFAHEIGHLIRYIYVDKEYGENFIEESFAICNEFLLLDFLINNKKLKKIYFNDINNAILSFLSKVFDTIECFLFQEYLLKELENETKENTKEKILEKRKINLEKMGYKNITIKIKDFALKPSYLSPYYSLNYFIGIFLGFEMFQNIKNKRKCIIEKKNLEFKDILIFLEKKNLKDVIDIKVLFDYFNNILK